MSSSGDNLESFVKNMYDNPGKDLVLILRTPVGYDGATNIKNNGDAAELMSNLEGLRTYSRFSLNKTENGTLHASINYDAHDLAYADIFSINAALSKISEVVQSSSYKSNTKN